jgi:hypothetical protein
MARDFAICIPLSRGRKQEAYVLFTYLLTWNRDCTFSNQHNISSLSRKSY